MSTKRNTTHKAATRGNRSLWFRLLSFSAVWTVFALVLGGYLLSLTFKETIEDNFDKRLNRMLESLIGVSSTLIEEQASIYRAMVDSRFEQPYSGWYWQVSAPKMEPFRSRSLWDINLEPDLKIPVYQSRFSNVKGPENQNLRMVERDITIPGNKTVFRFSVAIDRSEIKAQLDRFDNILIYSLSALGIGLIAASLLQVYLGLNPLRNIRRSLALIRSGRRSHLPDNFPTEIKPLVDEMNALLDHNNQIVERSRTQVGNLAHALKTPLAVLLNESELHKGQLSNITRKQSQMMQQQVDHYLRRARAAGNTRIITSRTEVLPVLKDISRALAKIYRDKDFRLHPPECGKGIFFRGERHDIEDMVGNLVENAAKWSNRTIILSCSQEDHRIIIQVADDGPGIREDVREAVFTRGERLDEERPGTGLGLSIVRELTDLYGGKVDLLDNMPRGLLVRLTLPAVTA